MYNLNRWKQVDRTNFMVVVYVMHRKSLAGTMAGTTLLASTQRVERPSFPATQFF